MNYFGDAIIMNYFFCAKKERLKIH